VSAAEDAEKPGALVPAPNPGELIRRGLTTPAALKVARTLDEAGPDAVVVIDRHGDLMPWWRLRALSALSSGITFGLFALVSLTMVQAFGLAGLAAPMLLGLLATGRNQRRRIEWRAMALVQAGRLDEAEAVCQWMLARRGSRQHRAWAHRCLAIVESRRGRHAAALSEVRAALKMVGGGRWQATMELLALQEIRLLVETGQLGEARARLEGRKAQAGRVSGEVVEVQRWLTELYLQFAERKLTVDDDELWRRGQRALKLSGGAQLLALCAWGFAERRDDDMASHLLGEAADRYVPWMKRVSPALWAWVESRLGRALPEEADGE
jgi:hypothetical protein